MAIRLHLLGLPKVQMGESLGDLPLDKPASLLYYLAQRGDWIGRAELAFLYRPDAPEEVALANVRKFIHRAKEFAWAQGLEVEKFRVRFAANTDVQAFRRALEEQDWALALRLYRGRFLEGLHLLDVEGYETWLELEREELGQKWRMAVLNRVKQLEDSSEPLEAEGLIESLLKADPLDEEALQAYLRVLHQAGKRGPMIAAYEAFCQELKRELGVEPLATTKALLDSLKGREPLAIKPRPVQTRPVHNLPLQTTRFVGRTRELEQLSQRLCDPDCRLITLMGLGGMGKTRLGLELAQQQLDAYADGVWFVPLAGVAMPEMPPSSIAAPEMPLSSIAGPEMPLSSIAVPEMLVSSIATALGLVLSGDDDPKHQLLNYLRHKQCLLLLDNFEHLAEGALLLEELLEAAPALKLIVTSRIALELRSEQIFDLEGLAYPGPDSPEPLESFDSVRLFIARAERLSKTFVAAGSTLKTIAALCRKVQGMPLALELTATWTRSVGVAELLESLEQGFDLLTTTQRDVPERHRNLQVVLDYTWQRLSAPEQMALSKLSLFRGGFTLGAAEQVAGLHLSMLLRLINQGLVRRDQEGRYDLHELVRQYAHGFLHQARNPLEQAFCHYYLGLLAHSETELYGPRQLEVKQQLLDEIENLRQVFPLAIQHQRWAELEAAFTSLHLFYRDLGYFQEGRSLFARMGQALVGGLPQPRLLARAKLREAYFARHLEPFLRLEPLLLQTIEELRALNIADDLALALQVLGSENRTAGYLDRAEPLILESCALSKNNPYLYAVCLLGLSNLLRDQGRHQEASEVAEQSLNLRRSIGDLRGIAMVMAQLANVARDRGDLPGAKIYSQQALEIKRQLGDQRQISRELGNLAIYAVEEGRLEQSERLLLESLALKESLGESNTQAVTLSNLGEVYRQQGQYARAQGVFERALKVAEQFNLLSHKAMVLVELAENFRLQDQLPSAESYLRMALKLAHDHQVPSRIPLTGLLYLAKLKAQASQPEGAYLLCAFIVTYNATLPQTRQRAKELMQQLGPQLPAQKLASLQEQAARWSLKQALEEI